MQDNIFKEDIAMSNFIKMLEGGEDDFVLATEFPGCCVKARMSKNEDDMFEGQVLNRSAKI